uniref:Photosystem I reaction center subunit XII n=1 Tax=Sphaeropteris brunoniana TaxID=204593 RepID=A0A7L8XKM5_9MONI|nr:photosystem I reaction center subunit M [Sphaeropteris brunoniana]YP_010395663.1 photosystem I protein M [Cyathea lepifera]QKV46617.1 photosystem I reaction center subunit M [Cyathea lepifera]QOH97745.1 photosystem I reaction center subunit M [Sphaeropteris brunoniana]UQJ73738.1 photosystem I protein M [Cyathea lepifera]
MESISDIQIILALIIAFATSILVARLAIALYR